MVKNVLARMLSYARSSLLLKTAVGSFSLKLFGAGLGFVGGILFARILGPRGFGIYTLAMAVITLAASVSALGLPSLLTREIAGYGAREQWGLLKGIIYAGHKWILLSFLALLGVAALIVFGVKLAPAMAVPIFVIGALLVLMMVLNQLRAAVLRGVHRVILADIPDLLVRPVLIFSMLVASYVWLRRLDPTFAIALQLIAAVSAFLVGSWFLRIRIPRQAAAAAAEGNGRWWAREAQSFFWIGLLTLLEGQIAIYFLGYLADPRAVGMFQAAGQFVVPVTIGLVAVNTPLQPKLVTAWTTGDKKTAQSLVAEAARLGGGLGLISAVIMLPFAVAITYVYGQPYEAAVSVLRILVIGQLFNAVAGPCALVLASTGYQRVALRAVAASIVINTLVSFVLIPQYGADGAAMAVATSLLTWNGIMVYATTKLTKLKVSILQVGLPRVRC